MIESNERHRRDYPALIQNDRTVTHGEFAARSRQLASALNKAGCRKQDRVSMLSLNSIEQCLIYGAGELSGYITAPINFRLAGEEIVYQVNDCLPLVLFFQSGFTDLIGAIRDRLPSIRQFVCIGPAPDWATDFESFLATGDPEGTPFRADEDDVAYLVYTSGTTGKPKGCMLGHKTQMWTILAFAGDMGLSRMDRGMVVMPLFHIGAKDVQLAVQLQGGALVIADKFDPDDYLQLVQDQKVTVGHLAPTMIQTLLESSKVEALDLSSLRLVLYSAAAMPVTVLRRAIARFGQIFQQAYGLTESAGTSLHRLEHDPDGDEAVQRRLRSVGTPFIGVDLMIADDAGRPLPIDTPGEILFRSPGNMLGYWNNTAASIDALRDGWFRTGDMGVLDEDGYCYIVDRKKDMINSGGENIYSREVEEALLTHAEISEVSVIGIDDPKWGEAVCAIVVTTAGSSLTEEAVVEHSRSQLASYKKPRKVVFVDSLPKLASGKVDKVALRKAWNG
ncbi:MAG: AMP-binding protein [Alphaproteobacteria bacterium]|nr:AMP-binding protein [Alphaproteobacteria bacterium]